MRYILKLFVVLTFLLWDVECQVLSENDIAREIPRDGKKFKTMFGSESLQCVTCKKLVEEFEWAINSVDPKKKIESGIWGPDGKNRKIVSSIVTAYISIVYKNFIDVNQKIPQFKIIHIMLYLW